ncbi:carboxypeptidase-like regulatory domain-containing protein [Paractinoplanes tereljensis]|uniref:carboxypeptidase-like regulatory domain-containing protein n=1 Tax=Paractinoplanes tereljensis TaxID=571912 RepID=UPI001942E01F|nr:carboxypeptidase-like regulatory domain-containing protein [Actinoplanes tereljensis]
MTTHLRARVAQAGALLAVVLGVIVVAPAVALADPPEVQITSLPTDVVSGNSLQMGFKVRAVNVNGGAGGQATATIKVTGMTCDGCNQIAQVSSDGTDFSVKLTAPTVNAGTTQTVNISVSATINGESNSTSQPVNVKGPDKPQTVTSISGKVKDQDGKAISGAAVAMKDSAGHAYQTTTNGSGGYSFNSSDSSQITPGNISVGALKDGFNAATVQIQAAAGKSVSVPLTLKAVEATASATPSASVSAAASAEALDEATEDPTDDESTAVDANTENKASESGGGSGSMLFIIVGGLLVAAGVGAIVLVLMRRKNNGEGGGVDDDPTSMPVGPGGVVPPSQGRFNDATRVASPMGAGPAATMMAPRAASPMSDAPTMLHRPVEDEFPDPYGVPVPNQGGYAGGGGGTYGEPAQYGRPQDDGYGGGQYGAPQGGGQYGAPQGGGQYGAPQGGQYGAAAAPAGAPQQRYDEPTGMYRPEAAGNDYDEYDQPGAQQYGGAAQGGQYGGGQQYGAPQGGQYGAPAAPAGQYGGGGYDDQAGYGPQQGGQYGAAPQGGQYGAPQGGGYDQYSGGQGGQYGAPAAPAGQYGGGGGGYDQGGYGDQRGDYNEQNRHGGQPPRPHEPSQPGQRRSLDWMDN